MTREWEWTGSDDELYATAGDVTLSIERRLYPGPCFRWAWCMLANDDGADLGSNLASGEASTCEEAMASAEAVGNVHVSFLLGVLP